MGKPKPYALAGYSLIYELMPLASKIFTVGARERVKNPAVPQASRLRLIELVRETVIQEQ
jgi:hypothetical protein